MKIVLVPGLWLNGSSWASVTPLLERAGHTVTAVTLPGLESVDTPRAGITLADHVSAVLAATGDGPALLVGHSASATTVYLAADARPEAVAGLVYIGGFPGDDGSTFMGDMPVDGDDSPFPGWAAFEGPDSADLSEAAKAELLAEMVPTPSGVTTDTVVLRDERRRAIPATVICPEFSPADLTEWIDGGHLPELASATSLTLVDIDSGHWPQVTQPAALAALILEAAERV